MDTTPLRAKNLCTDRMLFPWLSEVAGRAFEEVVEERQWLQHRSYDRMCANEVHERRGSPWLMRARGSADMLKTQGISVGFFTFDKAAGVACLVPESLHVNRCLSTALPL